MARINKKDKRIALMEEAVNTALALFPEIERWAFGEGGIITPTIQRKFDEVQRKLEYSKNVKIANNLTTEGRKSKSDKMMVNWCAKRLGVEKRSNKSEDSNG